MIEKNFEYIYNLDYLICVPTLDANLYHGFSATFNNVILFNNQIKEYKFMQQFLKVNNIKKIIFVDHIMEFDEVIKNLDEQIEIEFIFTRSLSALSDEYSKSAYNQIFDYYNKKIIKYIGLIDENLYHVLKDKNYNVKLIKLKSNLKLSKDSNQTIGLLNNDYDFKDSFFNELSALSILEKKAKLLNPNYLSKNFCKEFNIIYEKVNNYEDNIANNELNLYINFTKANILPFIDSMNNDIPCLLGNTPILDNYPELKKYLVLDSDDDINEIAEKINQAINNKTKILELYKVFKKDYEKEIDKLKHNFLGYKEEKEEIKEYDYLLSVIIPVYNVEPYLQNCLDSLKNAITDEMEIILINDGSIDNSPQIASNFAQENKNVRYITQENHGLGNVRNVGLKEAKGKYIAAIDSDDKINSNFFKEAINYLKKDVDIVIYDWLSIKDEERFITPALDKGLNIENNYKTLLYTTIMPSACNKIIKKSLYEKLDLNFAELKYEDFSTNPFVLMKANKIKYINKPYYEYMIRENSIMRNKKIVDYDMINIIKLIEERFKLYPELTKKINILEFKNYVFWWRIEELIINKIYDLDIKDIKKYVKYLYDNIGNTLEIIYKDNDFVNKTINKFDDATKNYIIKRNEAILNFSLDKFIIEHTKDYKIITAAMILYNYDNRGEI